MRAHCILGGLVLTCIVLRLAEAHLVAEEYPSVPECGDTALRIRAVRLCLVPTLVLITNMCRGVLAVYQIHVCQRVFSHVMHKRREVARKHPV